MSPRSWGFVGPRQNNPVGWGWITVGLVAIAEAILDANESGDWTWQSIAQVVIGALVSANGEKIRRQPPAFRDPSESDGD